jgi:hypothetical protein
LAKKCQPVSRTDANLFQNQPKRANLSLNLAKKYQPVFEKGCQPVSKSAKNSKPVLNLA